MNLLAEIRKLQSKYGSNPQTKDCLEESLQLLEVYHSYIRSLLKQPQP